jgi:hypothetical protein
MNNVFLGTIKRLDAQAMFYLLEDQLVLTKLAIKLRNQLRLQLDVVARTKYPLTTLTIKRRKVVFAGDLKTVI